ncbi:hypothetical protein BST81_11060 [Leptolyngbya sp. 'hensonii']|uniref:NB-ARC domain-containing protein n=1 Tax=Leptolyngbya sp. 'hensonii' TaxID=1922337 RepID=UPI00094FBC8C|nr:NB-ARC domain-containing protein [Leptolyngbya sp. 'hensonii']OLP18370.1 hypothetical protein BST81_11060 [Leptolyngbya sp. 'hensonii']
MTDPVTSLAELIADAIAGNPTKIRSELAIAQTQTLYQLVQDKFQHESEVSDALAVIEQGSSTALDHLIEHLKLALQQDAEFAAEAQAIIQSIYPEKLQSLDGMTMTATGNAQAFQTKVEGGTAYVGNNYITQPQPLPSPVGIPENLPRSGIEPEKFVGRADELKWLHHRLQQENCVAISAIAGMGGVGKTELALQYAIAHQNDYSGGVCWIEAREQNVAAQIVDFATVHLGLNLPNNLTKLTDQVCWCWQHWNLNQVLIIFNDVADYANIRPYLPPPNSRFHVLLTTRLRLLKDSERLELNVLHPDAAMLLLGLLTGAERVEAEAVVARTICQWLGYLPLGLELVGRYLARKPDLSLAAMLERLQAKRLEQQALKKPKSEADMTAQMGVADAFDLSWREIPSLAQMVGCFLSIFDVVPIPWNLVEECFPNHEEEELEEARDDFLLAFHLLQREGKQAYRLHELIREFFQVKLVELEQTDSLWQAVTLKVAAIAKHNPLLVSETLRKKWLNWQWITDVTQLTALDWGWQVRTASHAWIEGLGALARITFHLRDDGTLPTLGVSLNQQYLDQPWGPIPYVRTGWSFSPPRAKTVVDLPPESQHIFQDDDAARISAWSILSDAGWNHFTSAPLNLQTSWAWQRTFEGIVSSLTARLKDRSLPVQAGYLSLEAAWYAAAHLLKRDPFLITPTLLDTLEEPLSRTEPSSLTLRMQHCYKQLRIEIEAARHRGQTHLCLPLSVQNFRQHNWAPDSLLAYATNIYQGAVEGYERIVTTWFSRLVPKLPLAAIFPVQLVGVVVPPCFSSEGISISQFWQPLPKNQLSGVDFRLSDRPISTDDSRWRAAQEQFRSLHPQTSLHPNITVHSTSRLTSQWLGVCPVTELVYQWLWNDLQRAGWVKEGRLEEAGHPYWR